MLLVLQTAFLQVNDKSPFLCHSFWCTNEARAFLSMNQVDDMSLAKNFFQARGDFDCVTIEDTDGSILVWVTRDTFYTSEKYDKMAKELDNNIEVKPVVINTIKHNYNYVNTEIRQTAFKSATK